MKIRFFILPLLFLSLALNIFLYFQKKEVVFLPREDEPLTLYPTDYSSIDFPLSYDIESNLYKTFSLDGETILFADFVMKGSILDSFYKKYNSKISTKLIRNLQELVYFLNGFKIRFHEGDRLTFFYTEKGETILYLRFENSLKRLISEVYFFNSSVGKEYFTADGYKLQPCITNGPFSGCPKARFLYENNNLVPIFDSGANENVQLPFLAKIVEVEQSKNFGGSIELIYSNFAAHAFFRGLGRVNSALKKNALYKEGTSLGKSGFVFSDGKNGVIYYVRKRDNSIVSPYSFHHIERGNLEEKDLLNFQITKNFYARVVGFGKKYEADNY